MAASQAGSIRHLFLERCFKVKDGKEYVDLLIGSGPMLLGHGHPEVLDAVMQQLPKGMTFSTNNTPGIELAEEISRSVKCAEQVRYVCTGSEADMYAMRLARAFTGRDTVIRFRTHFHGWNDHMSSGQSGHMDGTPTPGVVPARRANTSRSVSGFPPRRLEPCKPAATSPAA